MSSVKALALCGSSASVLSVAIPVAYGVGSRAAGTVSVPRGRFPDVGGTSFVSVVHASSVGPISGAVTSSVVRNAPACDAG